MWNVYLIRWLNRCVTCQIEEILYLLLRHLRYVPINSFERNPLTRTNSHVMEKECYAHKHSNNYWYMSEYEKVCFFSFLPVYRYSV